MLASDLERVRALERAALDAWPAEEVSDVDGWKLRYMRGVTRRANSAWTNEARGALSLSERVERAEAFYADRGEPPRFQLSPASEPELDAALAARGYAVEAPVAMLTASAAPFAALEPGHPTRVEPLVFDAWFEISAAGGRFTAVADVYRGLLDRLHGRGLFALAELDAASAGVGLGVLDGARCGIFSMLTASNARRRGVGRAVLVALARAALERGARELYLQVERENGEARALYEQLGFEERYGYHYRLGSRRL